MRCLLFQWPNLLFVYPARDLQVVIADLLGTNGRRLFVQMAAGF
jgi:hypothetical protein